jgi:hypothetical protein
VEEETTPKKNRMLAAASWLGAASLFGRHDDNSPAAVTKKVADELHKDDNEHSGDNLLVEYGEEDKRKEEEGFVAGADEDHHSSMEEFTSMISSAGDGLTSDPSSSRNDPPQDDRAEDSILPLPQGPSMTNAIAVEEGSGMMSMLSFYDLEMDPRPLQLHRHLVDLETFLPMDSCWTIQCNTSREVHLEEVVHLPEQEYVTWQPVKSTCFLKSTYCTRPSLQEFRES